MKTSNYLACPECDLLLQQNISVVGDKIHCPRCNYLLHRPRTQSVPRTFALSLTGLFLLFPASLLPIVGVKILGNTQDGTILSGVVTLFHEGMWGFQLLFFYRVFYFRC